MLDLTYVTLSIFSSEKIDSDIKTGQTTISEKSIFLVTRNPPLL